MEFSHLLHAIENEPVFETGLLLSGDVDPFNTRKQLTRWTTSGKLFQLRRGLYCLAPPYQKVIPHPFLIANRLLAGSYVSLQSALAHFGMIPELVPTTTSVTTTRTATFHTPLGQYDFHHIQVGWLRGFTRANLGNDQWAFIATPEKALLDLVYLQPGGEHEDFLLSLRLQALDRLNLDLLQHLAAYLDKPKLLRAAGIIRRLAEAEKADYKSL